MTLGGRAFEDPDNYLPLARYVASGEGLSLNGRPTAYRPPLYPIALAPLVWFLGTHPERGIAVLHLLLGAAAVGLTAHAASRWGAGAPRSAIAAWIVALDPVLAWQARSVMTETLGAALVAAVLASLADRRWRDDLRSGILFGLSGLCRPSLLPAAFLTCSAILVLDEGQLRGRLRRAATIGLGILCVMAPWAVRNALVFGEPVWTTTHGGYTLALANNEIYYRDILLGRSGRVWSGDDQWRWWDSVNRATAGMREPEADRLLRQRVIRLALERPGTFLTSCLDRLVRFWSVAPAGAVYSPRVRLATAAWTVPLWIALGLGFCRRGLWRWPDITAPLQLLGLTLVHILYWTDLRMRAPLVPAIALIAATALWNKRAPRKPGKPDQETAAFSVSTG
jgi:hypothetical protein